DRDDQEEVDVGDSRGVAHAVPGEPDLIDVQQDRSGGAAGTAAGHLVDLVEDLQRIQQLQHQHQHGDGGQLRQGDGGELPPTAGPVERGRLIEVLGDVLQSRQVQQEVETDGPPHRVDDHREHGGV